ncbi:MAG: aspartate ammonia-lyase [Planctomycetes bacterium]|nr:aspartate ammonia-lyase [Planctomycetota bacterium]
MGAKRQDPVRIEHDLLGDKEVPAGVYWGVQTERARENFNISGVHLSMYPELIRAFAMIKMGAARANFDCGLMDKRVLGAIEAACQDLIDGKFHDQFPVDVLQGGAGTSTNMNANEVIANVALEHLGRAKGDYETVSPHDHVNLAQSTNDAYPSALHLAFALGSDHLVSELNDLVESFRAKGREFASVLKMGRTQLQDAVPMTLGQEFEAFAQSLSDEVFALERISSRVLLEVNMGGTAIGTGLNAPKGFTRACVKHLAEITGKKITAAKNLVEATQDTQAYVLYSSALKSLAIKLSKICNDLRLLSSGPRAGFGEISLPAMQPGSSIMPGKVNPVIPEVVNQVCFRVIGSDLTVTLAAEAGQLQLNVMEPVIAACILESHTILMNASRTLRTQCVDGIVANEAACRRFVDISIGVVTALNPLLGYDCATELAAEALKTGRGIVDLVRERKLLTEKQIAAVLDPRRMTGVR